MNTAISKWGNSLALRLPRSMAASAGMNEGTVVNMVVDGNRLIVTTASPKFDLQELLDQITEENTHEPTDWGPPVGNEHW